MLPEFPHGNRKEQNAPSEQDRDDSAFAFKHAKQPERCDRQVAYELGPQIPQGQVKSKPSKQPSDTPLLILSNALLVRSDQAIRAIGKARKGSALMQKRDRRKSERDDKYGTPKMPEKYEGNGATKICQDHEHLRNFALSRSRLERKNRRPPIRQHSWHRQCVARSGPGRIAQRGMRSDQITVAAKKKRKKPMLLLRKSKSLSIT